MVKFEANNTVNMAELSELALMEDYNNLHFPLAVIGGSFTATAGDISYDFAGSGFIFATDIPVSGTVESLGIRIDEQPFYSLSGLSLSVGNLTTLFNGGLNAAVGEIFKGNDTIKGSSGDDNLLGRRGDDTIKGHGGHDALRGGFGNDTLIGGNNHDKLFGNDGRDTLIGGKGKNELSGGNDADAFVFNTIIQKIKPDTITDFQHNIDKIHVDNAFFAGIGTNGALKAKKFEVGKQADDKNDRFIYDDETGKLFYDQDGSRNGSDQIKVAVLEGAPNLDAGDILVI